MQIVSLIREVSKYLRHVVVACLRHASPKRESPVEDESVEGIGSIITDEDTVIAGQCYYSEHDFLLLLFLFLFLFSSSSSAANVSH